MKSLPTRSNLPDRPNLSSAYNRGRCSIGSETPSYNKRKSISNEKYHRNHNSSLFSVAAAAFSFNSTSKNEKRSALKQQMQVYNLNLKRQNQ